MKELKHAMIDLETFDLIPSSKIISIGIVLFDPRLNKMSDTYYIELDYKAQTKRTSNKDTLLWWRKQSSIVRKALHGTTLLEDALEDISFFLPKDCKVWGNGSTFDISIMEDAYREHQQEIPWKYWNVRDCRTIKDLYESSRGGFDKKVGGNAHNALDDAIHQAKYVSMMWNKLLDK